MRRALTPLNPKVYRSDSAHFCATHQIEPKRVIVDSSPYDVEAGVKAYRDLLLVRRFEERCLRLFLANKVRGAQHLYTGQEAVAVGASRAMNDDDAIGFTYRSHGWALAQGITPTAAFAEIFGRSSGCSAGRGGSKHLGDWDRRILPSNAIVGAHLPLVAGVAFADRLNGKSTVGVAAFGDGAMNQGVVHETMTLASLWKLPMVFVCENNQYGEMTPVAETLPTATIGDRAAGHGIVSMVCDGMDVDDVTEVMGRALAHARSGQGPVLIEAKTYRFAGHHTGDAENYRSKEEVALWKERDPLIIQKARLRDAGVDDLTLESIELSVDQEIDQADTDAWESPEPSIDEILLHTPSWATVTA